MYTHASLMKIPHEYSLTPCRDNPAFSSSLVWSPDIWVCYATNHQRNHDSPSSCCSRQFAVRLTPPISPCAETLVPQSLMLCWMHNTNRMISDSLTTVYNLYPASRVKRVIRHQIWRRPFHRWVYFARTAYRALWISGFSAVAHTSSCTAPATNQPNYSLAIQSCTCRFSPADCDPVCGEHSPYTHVDFAPPHENVCMTYSLLSIKEEKNNTDNTYEYIQITRNGFAVKIIENKKTIFCFPTTMKILRICCIDVNFR